MHARYIPNRLPEHLDLEDIGDDLFCLPVQVRMNKSDVVCGGCRGRRGVQCEEKRSVSFSAFRFEGPAAFPALRTVACNHIAQRGQPLVHTLYRNRIGQAVAQMLQLLVRRCARHQQPMAVAHRQAAHEPRAGNAAVHDRDHVSDLGIESRVEIGAAADGDEAVAVGQACKHANLRRRLKGNADGHRCGSAGRGEDGKGARGRAKGQRFWGCEERSRKDGDDNARAEEAIFDGNAGV